MRNKIKHTIAAPTGTIASTRGRGRTAKTTYVSYRSSISPYAVIYTLDGGDTWTVNSWHSRVDLAEAQRRRLGYDGGDSNTRAFIIQPAIN